MGINLRTSSGNITLTAPKATGGSADLGNYYTKQETDKKIQDAVDAIPEVDLSGYVTDEEAEEFALKSEIPDVSGFAKVEDIPDVSGFATKEEIPEMPDLSGYALKTEIPDVSGFALKTEIPTMPDLSGYALKTEIPDVSAFQTEEQVNSLINTALGVIENGAY